MQSTDSWINTILKRNRIFEFVSRSLNRVYLAVISLNVNCQCHVVAHTSVSLSSVHCVTVLPCFCHARWSRERWQGTSQSRAYSQLLGHWYSAIVFTLCPLGFCKHFGAEKQFQACPIFIAGNSILRHFWKTLQNKETPWTGNYHRSIETVLKNYPVEFD